MSQEKECPVCYQKLTLENVVNLPCNHNQCSDCFWKWTNEQGKQSCCMCRADYLTHKNHHLQRDVEELTMSLIERRESLGIAIRREEQVHNMCEKLYEDETRLMARNKELVNESNNMSYHIERLEKKLHMRQRECYNLDIPLDSDFGKKRMSDLMKSKFYERRHEKTLDIAEKKRDGRYKKVLEELRRYHYNLGLIDDEFKKIVLLGNQLNLVRFLKSLTDGEVNLSESSWMFEVDETDDGFYVTQAQTTMKPVYADIRVDESKPSWMVSQNFMVWSEGNYERKIVNWLRPEDYNEGKNIYRISHFKNCFKRWHKRLIKALRLTSDIKTEKGHRKRYIDVVENRITRAYKTKNNIKINNENGLGDYGMSMFDEPSGFAGDETRLSLCMWTEYDGPNHGNHRPVLEQGQIDEIEEDYSDEALFGAEMLTSYRRETSDTESDYSSMPELIDENGDTVEEISDVESFDSIGSNPEGHIGGAGPERLFDYNYYSSDIQYAPLVYTRRSTNTQHVRNSMDRDRQFLSQTFILQE